jgi:hypothetical protein
MVAPDDFACPHCGAEVPAGSTFCRNCGASEDSGWDSDHDFQEAAGGYDQDDEFDYQAYLAREFPDQFRSPAITGNWMMAVIVILLCAVLVLGMVLGIS